MIPPDVASGEGVSKCPALCVPGTVSAIRLPDIGGLSPAKRYGMIGCGRE